MAKNLFEKAGRIQLPIVKPTGAQDSGAAGNATKPKTAPGTLMGFMATQSTALQENEALRTQLAHFEGSMPTRKLDPRSIRVSEWANRHVATFDGDEFAAFRSEIQAAGGNVQPIKVRPVKAVDGQGVGPSNGATKVEYELVYGHRRHRACLELGIPVLAVIQSSTDQELFVEMERENRNRADLSAWEQGVMYARALDRGLYPSNRQLAAAIGRDLGDVGKAVSLARLPNVVIEAFASPLDLQFRWAKPLNDAQQSDPEGLLERAKMLKGKGVDLGSKAVFESLIGSSMGRADQAGKIELKTKGKAFGSLASDAAGRVILRTSASLNDAQRSALAKLVEEFAEREGL
jgi:ParB family chromosome partitioning protein